MFNQQQKTKIQNSNKKKNFNGANIYSNSHNN